MKINQNEKLITFISKKQNTAQRVFSLALAFAVLFVSLPLESAHAVSALGGGNGPSAPTVTPEDAGKKPADKPLPNPNDPDLPALSKSTQATPKNTEDQASFEAKLDEIREDYASAFVTGKLTRAQFDQLITQSLSEKVEVATMVSGKGYSMVASSGNKDSLMSTIANVDAFRGNKFTLHTHADGDNAQPSLLDLNVLKNNAGVSSHYLVDIRGEAWRYSLSAQGKIVMSKITRNLLYQTYLIAVADANTQAEVDARAQLNKFVSAEQNKVNNRVKYGNQIVKFLSDGAVKVRDIISTDILTKLGFTANDSDTLVNQRFAQALGLPVNATFNQILLGLRQKHEVFFPNGVSLVGAAAVLIPGSIEPELQGIDTPLSTFDFPQGDTLTFQLIREFSGLKDTNRFGIYFVNADASITKQEIFSGAAKPGDKVTFVVPAGKKVGFYVETALGDTWFSEIGRNADKDNLKSHFKRFESDEEVGISSIAFEDLPDPNSAYYLQNKAKYDAGGFKPDFDYQDGYVTILAPNKNEKPIPNVTPVITPEDTPITFPIATDPDSNDDLTFQFSNTPGSGPDHGTITCDDGVAAIITCNYIPDPNYFGPDHVIVIVTDPQGQQVTIDKLITVTPVNDPPIATNIFKQTPKNTPISFNLIGSDPIEGSPVTYKKIAGPLNGTVVINAVTGAVTYTPSNNFIGTDTFTYVVNDGETDSAVATVTIQVIPPANQPPLAQPVSVTTPFGQPITFNLIGSDPDQGDAITYQLLSQIPAGHTLTCNANTGSCTYTPLANFSGTLPVLNYKVTDNQGLTANSTILIQVLPQPNQPPVAVDIFKETPKNTPISFNLIGSDPVEGSSVTYQKVGGPFNGTVIVNPTTGAVTYTPNNNFIGTDTFTYRVNDGQLNSNLATVTIQVIPPANQPPLAQPVSVTTPFNQPITFNLIGSDPDQGDAITYQLLSQVPAGHTLTCNNVTGSCNYTPLAGFSGTLPTLNYRVTDKVGLTANSTILIQVQPDPNRPPVAQPVNVTTPFNQPITFNLIGNDPDQGDAITYQLLSQVPAGHTLTCNSVTGSCTYTPLANFSGTLPTLNYQVTDSKGLTANSTLLINVGPKANKPPIAFDKIYMTNEDTPITFQLDAFDEDGDPLTYTLLDPRTLLPTHPVQCTPATGICSYTPPANFMGQLDFQFFVNDSHANSNIASIWIKVLPVNDPPTAESFIAMGMIGDPIYFQLKGNDIDLPNDQLTYQLLDPRGFLADNDIKCNASGACTMQSWISGQVDMRFRVTDQSGLSAEADFWVKVSTPMLHDFYAYDPGFQGGNEVASADVNGDGFADLITAAGATGGPHVKVFDGVTGKIIREFFAYDPGFKGGVHVAAADIDGDGKADIITGAGAGGGPHVKVFSGVTGQVIKQFFAYPGNFLGGVTVAAGDVNGDGKIDIITGAGPGGTSHVKVFDGVTGQVSQQWLAYPGFGGGVYVGAGDVDGDGKSDVITGAGAGGGPHVKVFSGATGQQIKSFFAYAGDFTGGVRVAAADFSGDGKADIITGAGAGGTSHVKIFDAVNLSEINSFNTYATLFQGGCFVAAGDVDGDGKVDIVTGAGSGPGGGPHVRAFRNIPGKNNLLGNNRAVSQSVSVTAKKGVTTSFKLPGSDPDNHPITYKILTEVPAGHSLVCDKNTGQCTYTPPAGFTGTLNLKFRVVDIFGFDIWTGSWDLTIKVGKI